MSASVPSPPPQDFFLRLVGGYRKFVRPDEEVTPAALALGLDRPLPAASTFVSTGGDPRNGKGVGKGGSADDENPRCGSCRLGRG